MNRGAFLASILACWSSSRFNAVVANVVTTLVPTVAAGQQYINGGPPSLGQWLHDTIQSIADSAYDVVDAFIPLPAKMEGFTLYESRDYWHANGVLPELADRTTLALQASGINTISTRHVAKLNEALYVAGATLDAYQRVLKEQYHKLPAREFEELIYHSQLELDRKLHELFSPLHPHSFHHGRPCHVVNTIFDHIVRAMCVPFAVFDTCRHVLEAPRLDHHHLAIQEVKRDHWIRPPSGKFMPYQPISNNYPPSPVSPANNIYPVSSVQPQVGYHPVAQPTLQQPSSIYPIQQPSSIYPPHYQSDIIYEQPLRHHPMIGHSAHSLSLSMATLVVLCVGLNMGTDL
eukprot:Protomagalhaensia_wolfi_Nauph_80__2254@NODE_246_length_3064_cov_20_880331_g184_i0_p2_GENE_NODE_246_length_3064_cov_20_880331_g184_i0NODE_246_length_3064_cov_20_880331_g184_i0_p2_ORF_typecomplete_len346_score21_56DisAlinker/PF10635_9/0_34G_path_suppress/PF15991_5/6_3_NODE_246_length_3064_cov_20_880331_g184_i014392476